MPHALLTSDDHIKILQERFKTTSVTFKCAEWASLSENIEGLMGEHYILKLTYILGDKESTETFFIKTKPYKTALQAEMVSSFNVFEKETFLYDNLFKEFERLGWKTSFAPKSYLCKDVETIVMEDLKVNGYKMSGRRNFFDIYHCKAALKALAYYHANSMAYEERKSKELGRKYRLNKENADIFNDTNFEKGGMGSKFIDSTVDCVIAVSKLLPESDDWKDSFEKRLKDFDCWEVAFQPLPYRQTCIHGDLWSNNMLFKYSDGIPTECCLVDFQMLRHSHTVYDSLLVVYYNTHSDFRKKHLEDLQRYYYDTFELILKSNGYDAKVLHSWEEFLKARKVVEPITLIQAVGGRFMSIIPPEMIDTAVSLGGNDFEGFMFKNRPQMVVDVLKHDEEFRRVFIGDIYDLNKLI